MGVEGGLARVLKYLRKENEQSKNKKDRLVLIESV